MQRAFQFYNALPQVSVPQRVSHNIQTSGTVYCVQKHCNVIHKKQELYATHSLNRATNVDLRKLGANFKGFEFGIGRHMPANEARACAGFTASKEDCWRTLQKDIELVAQKHVFRVSRKHVL